MRRQTIATWVMIVTVAVILLMVELLRFVLWWYNHEREEFLQRVHIGDRQFAVLSAVGPPKDRLSKGTSLPRWGGYASRVLLGDAWVYYRGPGSIDRLTVIFQDGVVVRIIHHPLTGDDPE
jgi:hypothetical protein